MSALSSSVINKSNKKIAPKASVQRRRPGNPSSSGRASTERQRQSQTPIPSVARRGSSASESAPPQPSSLQNPATEQPLEPVQLLETAKQHSQPLQPFEISANSPSNKEISRPSSDAPSHHPSPEPTRSSPVLRRAPTESVRDTQQHVNGPHQPEQLPGNEPVEPLSERPTKRRKTDRVEEAQAATTSHLSSGDATAQSAAQADVSDEAFAVEITVDPDLSVLDSADGDRNTTKVEGRGKAKTRRSSSGGVKRKSKTESAPVTSKRRGRREPTPDDPENVEIVPSAVKMADLCKDPRTGKKSKRELDLQNLDWTAVVRKQQEKKAQRERGEIPQQETVDHMLERVHAEVEAEPRGLAAPTLRLVNGKMVLDEQSLQVDRHANLGTDADTMEEVEENELTRRVTSGSWMKRVKKETWGEELTDLFYQALRMFGTDFQIISGMFPGKTRRHIKLKFTREERLHPERVKEALMGPRERADLAAYSQHTKVEYADPAEFEKELGMEAEKHAEEQKRQDEEAEELLRQQRIDNGAGEEVRVGDSSAKENEAQDALDLNPKNTKSMAAKKKRKPLGKHSRGEEVEVLGDIDDIQR
ncbi:MAG: E3 ubiquitin-protein ligase bre1 [Chaenotheca gracillima]|nr:MAG: E3 ubiquitin-protein ligase bre1 [Chaenotheca gracillima]